MKEGVWKRLLWLFVGWNWSDVIFIWVLIGC